MLRPSCPSFVRRVSVTCAVSESQAEEVVTLGLIRLLRTVRRPVVHRRIRGRSRRGRADAAGTVRRRPIAGVVKIGNRAIRRRGAGHAVVPRRAVLVAAVAVHAPGVTTIGRRKVAGRVVAGRVVAGRTRSGGTGTRIAVSILALKVAAASVDARSLRNPMAVVAARPWPDRVVKAGLGGRAGSDQCESTQSHAERFHRSSLSRSERSWLSFSPSEQEAIKALAVPEPGPTREWLKVASD